MKNKLSILLVLCGLLLVGTACSLGGLIGGDESDSTDSKTESTEKGGDSKEMKEPTSDDQVLNSGITECDELAKYINANTEEIEGSWIGKGILLVWKNYIMKSIEEGVAEMDEKEKEKLASSCKDALEKLKKDAKK